MLRRTFFGCCLAAVLSPAIPAAAQERSPFNGDKRLEQPVTVSWRKATLYDALQELTRTTGIKLSPDLAVVDEPIMAAATQVPARVLLEQIADLLDLTWSRSEDKAGTSRYLLYQSRAARERELAELQKSERAVVEALNRDLARYRQVAKMPEDQLHQQLEKSDRELSELLAGGFAGLGNNPAATRKFQDAQALRALSSPIGRSMLGVLDSLSPGQWNLLRSDRPLVFSSDPKEGELPLPASIQNQLRTGTPGFPLPKALFRALGPQVEQGIGQAERMMQNRWNQATGFKVTVHLNLNIGSQPLGLLRVNPAPLGEGDAGPQGDALFGMAGLQIMGVPSLAEEPTEDPAAREARLAADPVLGKKAKLALPKPEAAPGPLAILGQQHRVADVLPAVEKAFGMRLISDAYNRQAMSLVPPLGEGEIPLYRVLDTLAGTSRRWERDGHTIRFRSRTWAHDRRAEIPVRYMRRWLDARDKKGGFGLDDMAEIAALLRDEQVDSLMFSALEAGAKDFTDFVMISANRNILRFYGKLIPPQRRTLLAGAPILVRDLFPYQQALLLDLNRVQNRSMFSIALGAKPQRGAAQLANATIRLTRVDRPQNSPQGQGDPPPTGNASPMNAAAMGISAPTAVYTLVLDLGQGQKDTYTLPLIRAAARP